MLPFVAIKTTKALDSTGIDFKINFKSSKFRLKTVPHGKGLLLWKLDKSHTHTKALVCSSSYILGSLYCQRQSMTVPPFYSCVMRRRK